jgi:spore coat assembly protein SafA
MFFIARRFNISLQSLINANPQVLDPNTIYPGQVICIPVGGPSQGVPCPGGQIYQVLSGDTMFDIARSFGVTLDALIQANPQITNPDLIFPGQEICIPGQAGPVPCPAGTLYVVMKGDTLFEIAQMNGISLASLIMANPQIPDPNLIYPGQTICIPKPAMEKPVPMPMPLPVPMPMPLPAPMPEMPMPEMPIPEMPMPCQPAKPCKPCKPCKPLPPARPVMPVKPAPPARPLPPVTSPIVSPVPPMPSMPSMPSMPPMMPCPPAGPMNQTMPVYIVIPWEECPYRCQTKKRKGHGHRKGCR